MRSMNPEMCDAARNRENNYQSTNSKVRMVRMKS